jgi:hypothetical protein
LTPEQLQEADAQLRTGFKVLTALYLDELHGSVGPEKEVRYKSEYVSTRYLMEFRGKELPAPSDRFIVRGVGVMYSLPRAYVQVTPVAVNVGDEADTPL